MDDNEYGGDAYDYKLRVKRETELEENQDRVRFIVFFKLLYPWLKNK